MPSDAKNPLEEGTPCWVKVFGIVAIILILLMVVLHLAAGGHVTAALGWIGAVVAYLVLVG